MYAIEHYPCRLPVQCRVADYDLNEGDGGTEIQFSSASAISANLPPVTQVANGWTVALRNIGSGALTISPSEGALIDGAASTSLATGVMRWIRCDGTGWKTISLCEAGGGGGSGVVLQSVVAMDSAVATGTGTISNTDATPSSTNGTQFMSVAFTPISASSSLLIEFVGLFSNSTNGAQVATALFLNSETSARATTSVTCDNGGSPYTMALMHQLASPGTTANTFKIRAGGHVSGTTTFNGTLGNRLFGGTSGSLLRVSEIA